MAVSIIRQLTLAQVQAAIDAGSTSWNNNYAGTQVYVTDKDWHLACYLDRIAKPLSGVLKINNGDTLPAWLTPETLLIDTGVISTDINLTPLEITTIAGYYLYSATFETAAATLEGVQILDSESSPILAWNANSTGYTAVGFVGYTSPTPGIGAQYASGNLFLTCTTVEDTSNKQAIIEFRKSYL